MLLNYKNVIAEVLLQKYIFFALQADISVRHSHYWTITGSTDDVHPFFIYPHGDFIFDLGAELVRSKTRRK